MERAIFAYKYPGVRALFQGAVCLFRGWLCGCVGLLSQILGDGSQRVAQPKILFERVLGQKPLGILVLQDATQDHNQCWFMLFARPPTAPSDLFFCALQPGSQLGDACRQEVVCKLPIRPGLPPFALGRLPLLVSPCALLFWLGPIGCRVECGRDLGYHDVRHRAAGLGCQELPRVPVFIRFLFLSVGGGPWQ